MKKEINQPDILDQVRKAEKVIKTHLLIKRIAALKVLAKEVRSAKKEAHLLLEDIGIEGKDVKRVIDFVNDLPETQLSREDVKKIKNKVRRETKEVREEIQEKMEEAPIPFVGATTNLLSTSLGIDNLSNTTWTTTNDSNEMYKVSADGGVQLMSGDNSVEVKI